MIKRQCKVQTSTTLDPFEVKILRILQHDASLSTSEIGERVGLSTSPCWRRIDRLEREGVIRRRVAILDPEKLGLTVQVFVSVKLDRNGWANLDDFARAVSDVEEIVECFAITGAYDYILRVVTHDIPAYEAFVMSILSRLPGVSEINSMVAMSALKATTSLPLMGQ